MYASLWTLLQQKRKSNDIPVYYRICFRRPGENTMHDIRYCNIDEVIKWIAEESSGCVWAIEETRTVLTNEEV